MKLLVTGGCGFIGSNFIRYIIREYGRAVSITNLDLLTYAGNPENLKDLKDGHYKFVRGDIADGKLVNRLLKQDFEAVVNFAAESHVDRSLYEPAVFLRTNIIGTQTMLDATRRNKVKRFVQISTDEVYGSLNKTEAPFTENSPLRPSSPYSASKAGADLLVKAYEKTFGYPAIITRGTNNYGPYQFPEKVIPLFITNLLEDKPVPLYGKGTNIRDWLYVTDHCRAIDTVLRKGRPGEIYNIAGLAERSNLELTKTILKTLHKPSTLITYVKDRPGHDFRYALNISKIRKELGWQPKYEFEDGIRHTIEWYKNNRLWWKEIKSPVDGKVISSTGRTCGEYLKFIKKHYG